jgi:lysylphosphatidylglycerol synthetase-like protein (DUF2156 family)
MFGQVRRNPGRLASLQRRAASAGNWKREDGMLPDFIDTALMVRFVINLTAMTLLVFGLFYMRYRDKELVTAASLFNIFAFGVLSILGSVEFSLAAGFGLFAILALFTLRSEQISKIEITYFFGSISIAVICSIQGTTLPFVGLVVGLVLLGAYVFDHPRILKSVDGIKVTLDKIEPDTLSDPAKMRNALSARLGVQVMSYQIVALNYITDMAQINVFYRK